MGEALPLHPIKEALAIRLSENPQLEESTTNALKIECATLANFEKPSTYLVKFYSSVAEKGLGIVSELLVAQLCELFGLITPNYAVVEISEFFNSSIQSNRMIDLKIKNPIKLSLGAKNFGSEWIYNNLLNPLAMQKFSEDQLRQAEMIFGFDALIFNQDRSKFQPNIFCNNGTFILYDHEKAFSFLFGKKPYIPHELDHLFQNPDGSYFLRNHIFYQMLDKSIVNFDEFGEKLKQLTENDFDNMANNLPGDLTLEFSRQIAIIKNYIFFVQCNWKNVQFELMKVLK